MQDFPSSMKVDGMKPLPWITEQMKTKYLQSVKTVNDLPVQFITCKSTELRAVNEEQQEQAKAEATRHVALELMVCYLFDTHQCYLYLTMQQLAEVDTEVVKVCLLLLIHR